MKKILLLLLLIPAISFAADAVKTVNGVADSDIKTHMGVATASIKSVSGVGYNDGDSAGPIACSSYTGVECEDFDGATACGDGSHTNCQNTYDAPSGTVDFNAASTYGNAASLYESTANLQLYTNKFTETNPIYFLIYFKLQTVTSNSSDIIRLMSGDDVYRLEAYVGNGGKYGIFVPGGSYGETATGKVSANTWYWFRGYYNKDNGSNAIGGISLWTGSAWEDYTTDSGTQKAAGINWYRFYGPDGAENTSYVDMIKLSSSEFTNAPTTY